MSEEQNLETVQTVFARFGEGDVPRILELLDPDIVIEFYGPLHRSLLRVGLRARDLASRGTLASFSRLHGHRGGGGGVLAGLSRALGAGTIPRHAFESVGLSTAPLKFVSGEANTYLGWRLLGLRNLQDHRDRRVLVRESEYPDQVSRTCIREPGIIALATTSV
jgi:hypothetical protein